VLLPYLELLVETVRLLVLEFSHVSRDGDAFVGLVLAMPLKASLRAKSATVVK
jgi:hypothetical protein